MLGPKNRAALHYSVRLIPLLVLFCPLAGEAATFVGSNPGFWAGFVDGSLGLLKLLLSPLLQVTIIQADAQSWWYDAGVYTGALSFAAAAGMAAAPAEKVASFTLPSEHTQFLNGN
jgi:hypothetical protein